MSKQFNLENWFDDPLGVAAAVSSEKLFGIFKRSFKVPSGFVAMATGSSGRVEVFSGGAEINADNADEVLFVSAQPVDVSITTDNLQASDNYLCGADVALRVRVLPERSELESFRKRVMGSRQVLDAENLETYLQPAVDGGLREYAKVNPASFLVAGDDSKPAAKAISKGLEGPCFDGGLVLDSEPVVIFQSQAYAKVQLAHQQAARSLDEHQAQDELRRAIAGAQEEKLSHLESMLNRLQELAQESPEVELPDLMKAFNESQRAQLYEALFQSRAKDRATRWLAIASGAELLVYDTLSLEKPERVLPVDGGAGALRSVQLAGDSGSRNALLLGAATGVYWVDLDDFRVTETYSFAPENELRGGVNGAVVAGDYIVATHSEAGVICWPAGKTQGPVFLFPDLTASAKAVRNTLVTGDCFWCSIDNQVLCVPFAEITQAKPRVLECGPSTITSLAVFGGYVYAGDADGCIRSWPDSLEAAPTIIHRGSRRPAESIAAVTFGGIPALFYTDTSLAVHSRVLGDSFTCRYEATGQTIRRAEVAPDIVAGTTDSRDRVIVWDVRNPLQPSAILQITRQTGRSVQDVCLVPLACCAKR